DVVGQYRRFVEETAREQMQVSSETVVALQRFNGLDDGPVVSGAPATFALEVKSLAQRSARIVVGLTEGSASPVFLTEHIAELEAGLSLLTCRLEQLPVAAGEYAVWATVLDVDGTKLLGWSPVGHTRVGGPALSPAPTGVVRLSPVVVNASWGEG